MPNFLGHFFGVSFRTERLIMNIIGLFNSTLDWHPLKWTNKLEQIWNLSLSQRTHILDTIGEERIKAILSYIVIARILIAHVFTLSYMTNFYPIITWSRPTLLLPWLILSFFKNVVLEVIVIAVGLLLWYDRRFSLPIFLEFVVVKVVPLVFAAYNWYSNSCLYLELRHFERMRRLRRSMRSDSNLIASRLYLKIADSKYKTRSVTTLISWGSYETYDTNDTISRIIDDANLSPAEKTMKILGITEHDVDKARTRVKERTMRQKLTEVEEEEDISLCRLKDTRPYFAIINKYEFGMKTLLPPRTDSTRSDLVKNIDIGDEGTSGVARNEAIGSSSPLSDALLTPMDIQLSKIQENTENRNVASDPCSSSNPRGNPASSRNDILCGNLGQPRNSSIRESSLSGETRSPTKKRGGIDSLKAKRSKQTRLCSTCHLSDFKHSSSFSKKRDTPRLCSGRNVKETVDGSCSPVKMQSMLNCSCMADEYPVTEKMEECCLLNGARIRTSTPNKTPDRNPEPGGTQNDSQYPKDLFQEFCETDCIRVGAKRTLVMNDAPSSIEKSMVQEMNIAPSLNTSKGQRLESMATVDDDIGQEVLAILTNRTNANSMECDQSTKEQCRPIADGVKNLSEMVKNVDTLPRVGNNFTTLENAMQMENETARTVVSVKRATNSASLAETSILTPYIQNTDKNLVNVNLSKYSFIDANIPSFYKDSMKVFDGCYEKDFANNSEVQCLLRQLEKKNWSLFHGHANPEVLIPPSILMQNEQYTIKDLRTGYHLTNDFENVDRYEVSVSSSSKANYDQLMSLKLKTDERTLDDISSMASESQNPTYRTLMKNVYTQTSDDDQSRSSSNSLIKSKRRGKAFVKRKRIKDETRTTSPSSSLRNRTVEFQSSTWKNGSRGSLRHGRLKTTDGQKKQPPMPTSLSDRSICECKMPQPDKSYNHSSEWKSDKKIGPKYKVDTYATVPLPHVARQSMFETLVYRRKPPVYPKKLKDEFSKQTTTSAASSKKLSSLKKLLEAPARKSTDKHSTYSSKKFKWKSKPESGEGQEARELRALKAYNEITLMRDKQELEAKQKLGKNSLDRAPQPTKTRTQTRKLNQDRSRSGTPRSADENYLDKENLSLDVATETDRFEKTTSKGGKAGGKTGKFVSVSTDKYPCSKLTKVNKVTDHLLDNFDRLHGRQTNQDSRKVKQIAETNTRKQYTKYSKPNKVAGEENVSVVSIKRLEGTQTGRELERTPAKEDVRDSSMTSLASCLEEQNESVVDFAGGSNYEEKHSTLSAYRGEIEKKNGKLYSSIKSALFKDVISTWSSSTSGQTEEVLHAVTENTSAESELRSSPKSKDTIREEIDSPKMSDKLSPMSSTLSLDSMNQMDLDGKLTDDEERRLESSRVASTRSDASLDEFARNIEVAYMGNYVLLTNPSAPKDSQPQRRTILDDDTIRMLQHAYSDRSLYFIFDISREILSVGDVLSSTQVRWDNDEFACQPNRETMGVPMEDLPPLDQKEHHLEQRILATIHQFPGYESGIEEDGSRNLYITAIDNENLSISADLEAVDDFDDDEDADEDTEHLNGFVNDVLSTVLEVWRFLNAGNLQLNTSFGLTYEVLQDTFDHEDYEIEEPETEDEEDDRDTEMRKMIEERLLRFIKEDILTDIKFPVVVNWTDVIAGASETAAELLEEFYIDLSETEPSKVNLFSFDEKEERKIGAGGKFEETRERNSRRNLIASNYLPGPSGLSSRQFLNPHDHTSNKNNFNRNRLEDEDVDTGYFGQFSHNPNKGDTILPMGTHAYKKRSSEEILNKTYDLLNDVDEVNEKDFGVSFEIEETENAGYEVVGSENEYTEIPKKSEQSTKLDQEETQESSSLRVEESLETIEKKFLNRLHAFQASRTIGPEQEGKVELQAEVELRDEVEFQDEVEPKDEVEREEEIEQENQVEEVPSEPMTLKLIFTFWFLVVYFYIQHFYQKMFTFRRVSRSTTALKPFEIHTVPTSATTLLENAELLERLQEGDDANSEQGEGEESSLFQGIIDLEEERGEGENNESVSDSDAISIETLSDNHPDEENAKTISIEFLPSNENVSAKFNANDVLIVELQSDEETEEFESGRTKREADSQPRHFPRGQSRIASHRHLDNVSESNETPVVPELDEGKRLELRQAEEEIEALRFREDDCSSEENERESSSDVENNFEYAERDAGEVDQAPNVNETHIVEKERFASFLSSRNEDESEEWNRTENMYEDVEMDDSEGSVFSKPKVEESSVSTAANQAESPEQVSNANVQPNDSFDSTYTAISAKSNYSESVPDLNDSSMEDFKGNELNESD